MTAVCPNCATPRAPGIECPRCGVIYARAEERARRRSAIAAEPAPFAPPEASDDLELDPPLLAELRLRLIVPPVALMFAFLFVGTGAGAFLARVLSGMWLHELGHALAAWLCGFPAVPLPWFTSVGTERSPVPTFLLLSLWVYLGQRAFRAGRRTRAGAVAAVSVLQLLLTLMLSPRQAQAVITFWGDGGALVLGVGLMVTFFVSRESRIHQGALRWGFLGLGALAFADVFAPWVRARRDPGEIPFGVIEGVGLSDPSKLVDVHGMSARALVDSYLLVGLVALAGFAVVYVLAAVRPALQVRRRPSTGSG